MPPSPLVVMGEWEGMNNNICNISVSSNDKKNNLPIKFPINPIVNAELSET